MLLSPPMWSPTKHHLLAVPLGKPKSLTYQQYEELLINRLEELPPGDELADVWEQKTGSPLMSPSPRDLLEAEPVGAAMAELGLTPTAFPAEARPNKELAARARQIASLSDWLANLL